MLHYEREQWQSPAGTRERCVPEVLLIDDNSNLLQILAEIISANGMVPRTAANATEAIDLLMQSTPDVIVCDIMMPEMNGFELLEYVSKNPSWASIPFVFLSALSDTKDVRFAKQQGCDDYLLKPFDPSDLIAVIRGKIAVAKHREAIQEARLDTYRRRIIHTLSHEFRTPLVAINTGTELLLEQGGGMGDDGVKQLLESIQRGGQRLHRMVDDFMTLQQIDSGVALSTCKRLARPVSIVRIAKQAISRFQDELLGDFVQIDLQADEQASQLIVNVFEIQMLDALQRVLANAHKFGGQESAITVRVFSGNGEVTVAVRDYGPGLPMETAEEVCRIFTQINRDRFEQQGAGIGLAVVSYYTDINGGNLSFHTPADGLGLEVQLSFPVVCPSK